MGVIANDEIYAFSVTIPAGTLQAAPVIISIGIPPRIVNQIDVVVPPGPSGLMGFQIGMVGQQIIPRNCNAWIITDGEKISWPVQNQNDSGAWQVIGYNTDIYDHTIQVKLLVDLAVTADTGPASPAAQATTAAVLALGSP
jgi:hypothetical protein